jgi:dTDP-4-dehydrorhamnose 3,5-epimerase
MNMAITVKPVDAECCPDVLELQPDRFGDERGLFSEVYNKAEFKRHGLDFEFIQDNQSLSADKGTVRGLHFQIAPFSQTKLIRVVRGAIFDVAVDIRKGSPTYGRHVSAIVSAEIWNQLLIPSGYAHGFCTLEANTEVIYKVDACYSPDHDRGLMWNDPALRINWPVDPDSAILSEKDRNHPALAQLPGYFDYA